MTAPVFSTHGCRLNAYETEAMAAEVKRAGIKDVVVVNTCAVTAEAVRKSKADVRKLRRANPDAKVIVTGCAAQTDPDAFAAMTEVDIVLGNADKLRPGTWDRMAPDFLGDVPRVIVDDIMSVTETAEHLIDGFGTRTRAHVQIQNGCDHRCTFCIIPYGRGNSRSVGAGQVVEQIQRLVDRGFLEIVLTGVDLTSWGADLPGHPRLGDLVRRILKLVPDLPRLRLSSIDSIEVDPALMEAIATEPRLMPHLHLSLQAGHDMILKRMKRRHLRDEAIAFCTEARAVRPDIVFGADIIAGFPTETNEMFQASLDLVDECGLTWLHVFPYSPRPGTPAARMPQVDRGVIKDRAARLRAAGHDRVARHLGEQVGRVQSVLTETPTQGRTAGFAMVELDAPAPEGAILPVRITGANGAGLTGRIEEV